MAEHYCPRCGAALDEAALPTYGDEFDCPECGERIRTSTVAPELAHDAPEAPSLDAFAEEDPPGERIQCRVAGNQLVLYAPPGSSPANRGIGCFGLMWTGFMVVFTAIMVGSGDVKFGDALFVVPFVGLFWAIGLTMLYFWFRGRFGKTVILVEPDRLVKKFELMGREKYREFLLHQDSRAKLVESYRSNDRLVVYVVAVSTASGKDAKFGTFFSRQEKRWIVDRINRHLGRRGS